MAGEVSFAMGFALLVVELRITDGNGDISLTSNANSAGQIYHEAKEKQANGPLKLRASATLNASP